MNHSVSDYVIWEQDIVEGACALSGMTGFADDWKLLYGESVRGEFPSRVRFAMDPDYPHDIALTDSLYNIEMLIVASEPLRELIEAEHPAAVEYLPVTIHNHKKRAVKEPYVIMHPIDPVDCLVVDACKPTYGRIQKTEIERVRHLVIDQVRVPADRLIFRPKGFARVVLTHRRLAQKIDHAGMSGIRWVELADYPES